MIHSNGFFVSIGLERVLTVLKGAYYYFIVWLFVRELTVLLQPLADATVHYAYVFMAKSLQNKTKTLFSEILKAKLTVRISLLA
jgi:hypothetical protein